MRERSEGLEIGIGGTETEKTETGEIGIGTEIGIGEIGIGTGIEIGTERGIVTGTAERVQGLVPETKTTAAAVTTEMVMPQRSRRLDQQGVDVEQCCLRG